MPNEHAENAPGQNKTHDIVINGQLATVSGNRISYEQVVGLAFPGSPFDILYSVSYSNPGGRDGTLAPGQDTVVKDGMSFNVIKTNRS